MLLIIILYNNRQKEGTTSNRKENAKMITLRHSETVTAIIEKLTQMETEFKQIMKNGTEQEKDSYLDKALKEVEKLNGKNATYAMWYMAFFDLRDGFTKIDE